MNQFYNIYAVMGKNLLQFRLCIINHKISLTTFLCIKTTVLNNINILCCLNIIFIIIITITITITITNV